MGCAANARKDSERKAGSRRNPCKSGRSRNPGNGRERADAEFRKWHEFEPTGHDQIEMPDRISHNLVMLGECSGVVYDSDKWQPGKMQRYQHMFKRGKCPPLFFDPVNNCLIIPGPPVAGAWSVTKDGLKD